MEITTRLLLQNYIELCNSEQTNYKLTTKLFRLKKRRRRRILLLKELGRAQEKIPRSVPKVLTNTKSFWDTIDTMLNDEFAEHFGMQIVTFEKLYAMLSPLWYKQDVGRPAGLTLKQGLCITLWKLTHITAFSQLSEQFKVSKSTSHSTFTRCANLISQQVEMVQFPQTDLSQRKTIAGFELIHAHPFPYVLGCVDFTYVKIPQPAKDCDDYYNPDGTYSIIVQAVADSELKFNDVFIGHPGSCNKATVWKNSPLRRAIMNEHIRIPSHCHLLADGTYPLEPFLMVPYNDNGHLTASELNYNNILNSTRTCVGQAFSVLKNKFRMLSSLEVRDNNLAKTLIMSCIVLHNFIIENEGSPAATKRDVTDTLNAHNNVIEHEGHDVTNTDFEEEYLTHSFIIKKEESTDSTNIDKGGCILKPHNFIIKNEKSADETSTDAGGALNPYDITIGCEESTVSTNIDIGVAFNASDIIIKYEGSAKSTDIDVSSTLNPYSLTIKSEVSADSTDINVGDIFNPHIIIKNGGSHDSFNSPSESGMTEENQWQATLKRKKLTALLTV